MSSLIKDNSQVICDSFINKFIYSTVVENHSEQEQEDNTGVASVSEGTSRCQMRGFELIYKILQKITLQEWIKVERRQSHKRNRHFQKTELVDLDITSKIIESVKTINENNFNLLALATNERSQL